MSEVRVYVQEVLETTVLQGYKNTFDDAIKSVKKKHPKSYKTTATYKKAKKAYDKKMTDYKAKVAKEVYDWTNYATSVSWTTSIQGQPGKAVVRLTTPRGKMNMGAYLALRDDQIGGVFIGRIFKQEWTDKDTLEITAYDQMRYLQNKDCFVFKKGTKAHEIFTKVCKSYALKYKVYNKATYGIPAWIADGKSLYDMVEFASDLALLHKGKWYIVRDEYGTLAFREINTLKKKLCINTSTRLLSYTATNSIDDDTYTRVRLYKEDSDDNRYTYTVTDADKVQQFGILQYYEKVDDEKSKKWIKHRAKALLAAKKRMSTTFELDCIGDTRLRAGDGVVLNFPELSEWNVKNNRYYFISECEHTWESGSHTMNLKMQIDFRE